MRCAALATWTVIVAALAATPTFAAAADGIPDLKGQWVADSSGIALGDPATSQTVDASTTPTILTNHIVLTIDFQQGRQVAGTKHHNFGQERFVGAIRADNRSLLAADAEGDMDARLLGEHAMEICYTEHSKLRAYASCEVYQRQH